VLKAIANPIRLRLVAALCEASHSVSELVSLLELKQSIVSQQLGILRRQRLVAPTRVGGLAIYRVTEPHLHEMLRCLESCRIG
jgi:ArsR family transcriptional regulator